MRNSSEAVRELVLRPFSVVKKKEVLIIAGAVLVALVVGSIVFAKKDVTILDEGRRFNVTARSLKVERILDAAGIELREKDEVSGPMRVEGGKGFVIQIKRAIPVTIVADGEKKSLVTTAPRVRDVLAEAGISLGSLDRPSVGTDKPLSAGMTIRVVRVTQREVTRRVPVQYRTEWRADKRMNRGTSKVIREGKMGLKSQRLVVTVEDGVPVKEKVLAEQIIETPVTKVVVYGTLNPLKTLATSRGMFRYRDSYTMVATAYEPGPRSCGKYASGYTAIGLKAQPGVVAVDPRVIPLKTRLYIEGYGPAIAGDVGSAIKGHRIDLCFNTVREALNFGRRKVKVYVLEPE